MSQQCVGDWGAQRKQQYVSTTGASGRSVRTDGVSLGLGLTEIDIPKMDAHYLMSTLCWPFLSVDKVVHGTVHFNWITEYVSH